MFVQFKNPALVKPQSLPDSIAALDGGIERADASFIAMNKPVVDVDDQIAVSFVEFLQHEMGEGRIRKAGTEEKEIQSDPKGPAVFPHFLPASAVDGLRRGELS